MVFQGIDFHNVEEVERCGNGYIMWRLPAQVRGHVNESIRDLTSRYSTGVELRFKLAGDAADIILKAEKEAEAQVAYVFYGSIQGGWQTSSFVIGTEETRIHIVRPDNLKVLQQITEKYHLPFSPEVVRIVLPYGKCYYAGAEGEVVPPMPSEVPQKTYLAYGSSITHGSLALAAPYTYPFRIAQKLGCDYINLGFAGSAQMEEAMAEYLVSRKDWDFASVEMGINVVKSFSAGWFEEKVDRFTEILSKDARPVFATDIFQCQEPYQEKIEAFREIVKKYASKRLIYTEGTQILGCPAHISADLVHPALEGVEDIVNNWCHVMKAHLG